MSRAFRCTHPSNVRLQFQLGQVGFVYEATDEGEDEGAAGGTQRFSEEELLQEALLPGGPECGGAAHPLSESHAGPADSSQAAPPPPALSRNSTPAGEPRSEVRPSKGG